MAKEEELKEIWKAMKEKGHFYGYDTYEAWRTRKDFPNIEKDIKKAEQELEEGKTIPLTKSKTYQSFRRSLSKEEEDDYKNIFGEN
jgi:hypothetical protein